MHCDFGGKHFIKLYVLARAIPLWLLVLGSLACAHLKNYALRSERGDFTQPLHTLISLASSQDCIVSQEMLILHLHASHNAPCFPPKVMNKNCLYIRLGTTVTPRKNEKPRPVGRGGGGGRKQGELWEMCRG